MSRPRPHVFDSTPRGRASARPAGLQHASPSWLRLLATLPMLLLLLAFAQADDTEIVHEYFDPERASVGGALNERTEVDFDDLPVPAPPETARPQAHERPVAADAPHPPTSNGRGGARSAATLDDDTTREGMLDYFEVFNPSIAPYKRVGALDELRIDDRGEYHLVVADKSLRAVEMVGDLRSPERDRFWASLLFEANAGSVFAIPSVAAEARILVAQTHPEQKPLFWKDGADNLFVQFPLAGSVRLNFVTDAAASYFAMSELPETLSLRELRKLYPIDELPKAARDAAKKVLREIGIDARNDSFAQALLLLTAYFRDFSAETLDASRTTGNRYLDIALQRRGVCRHRSFAFVITARALGINARYVFNEAHAFTEVMVPRQGWLRIDLGGAAAGLEVHASDQSLRYEARNPSVLDGAWPAGTDTSSPSGLAGFDTVQGMPEASSAPDGTAGTNTTEKASFDPNAVATSPSSEGILEGQPADAAPEPASGDALPLAAQPTHGQPSPPSADARAPIQRSKLSITSHPKSVRRGELLELAGMLSPHDSRDSISGATIYIMASSLARPHAPAVILTTIKTTDIGSFVVSAEVPPTLALGSWDVYAYFPGDERWGPSRSH